MNLKALLMMYWINQFSTVAHRGHATFFFFNHAIKSKHRAINGKKGENGSCKHVLDLNHFVFSTVTSG